jgi:hypothetical protein
LAFLATCDPDFPVSEWDQLLFQVELTLNLLKSSRVNPKLSAYAYLNGNFDFNKTPLAPPGTKVVVHLKPDQRASWAYHGKEGGYIGPSMEHYRCVKRYLPSTTRERDVDTLQFFPKTLPFPKISTEDYLKQAASDILAILQNPPSHLPYLAYGDKTNNALVQIATLLGRAVAPPPSPHLPIHPPRVPLQIPIHPPRVQTPLPLHPPRVPLPLFPPPMVPLTPPLVQISPALPSKPKPSLPRVHKPHTISRLHQYRDFRVACRKQLLQHLQATQLFQHQKKTEIYYLACPEP